MPSITRKSLCHQCDYDNTRKFSTLCINVDILLNEGLGKIQKAINDTLFTTITKSCPTCKSDLIETYKCGLHIIFDTSILTDPCYKAENRVSSILDDITKIISIGESNYILCGIINYVSYSSRKTTAISLREGHYVAITYTGINWYEYDDLAKTRIFVSPEKIVNRLIQLCM